MTAELACCQASPQDPVPYLSAMSRPAEASSISQAQPEPVPAHILPCQGHASCPNSMLQMGEARTHMPGSEETGTARDTQSRGGKEHSKKALAIHSLPLGQTLGSAAALSEESGHTQFSHWVPVLAWWVPVLPTAACKVVAILTAPPEAPLSKLESRGQASRELAFTLNSAQSRTHWDTYGSYISCIPKIRKMTLSLCWDL